MKRNVLLGFAGIFTVLTIWAFYSKECPKDVFIFFSGCAGLLAVGSMWVRD